MGTTLENGVYLPSEGERNCYAGLKTNWEILDQKVADVTALQQAVAGALHREIVESLPTTDIDPNTIYMILSGTSATENVYNEFMYVNNAWELIGTSATDLTNYYTKAEVDGKLLLKANASDLTSHTGDTTIHVTASDKAKWTNSANTVVLRLAKTALTPSSSTNAFSNLDDSTALKVGDKVIDSSGVLFSITAIDTQNSTFTIGTALIDLAQDSDVVHKSGDETVSGVKTFSNNTYITSLNFTNEVESQSSSSSAVFPIVTTVTYADQSPSQTARLNFRITANGDKSLYPHENNQYSLGVTSRRWTTLYGYLASLGGTYLGNEISANERTNLYLLANRDTDGQSGAYIGRFRQNRAQGAMSDGDVSFVSFDFLENSTRYTRCFTMGLTDWDSNGVPQTYYITAPNGKGTLGTAYNQWNKVYANNYYYGSNNVEFSTKFVTTDTDQTISSLKTFVGLRTEFKRLNGDGVILFSNGNFTKGSAPNDTINICRKYYGDATSIGSTLGYSSVTISDNGNKTTYQFYCIDNTSGSTSRTTIQMNYDKSLSGTDAQYVNITGNLLPSFNNSYNLGNSTNKWKTINGLNPSSLGMPDLNNGIDISSYITISQPGVEDVHTSTYTPTVNGFISVCLSRNGVCGVGIEQGDMRTYAREVPRTDLTTRYAFAYLPVVQNVQVNIISCYADSIVSAKFFPCQGNV